MPYMAVGSRQILYNDTQAPAVAQPTPAQGTPSNVDPGHTNSNHQVNPAREQHLGNNVDVRA